MSAVTKLRRAARFLMLACATAIAATGAANFADQNNRKIPQNLQTQINPAAAILNLLAQPAAAHVDNCPDGQAKPNISTTAYRWDVEDNPLNDSAKPVNSFISGFTPCVTDNRVEFHEWCHARGLLIMPESMLIGSKHVLVQPDVHKRGCYLAYRTFFGLPIGDIGFTSAQKAHIAACEAAGYRTEDDYWFSFSFGTEIVQCYMKDTDNNSPCAKSGNKRYDIARHECRTNVFPSTPRDFRVSTENPPNDHHKFLIEWYLPALYGSPTFANYDLQRSPPPFTDWVVAVAGGHQLSFINTFYRDEGVFGARYGEGTTFKYRLRAVNSQGNGPWATSEEVTWCRTGRWALNRRCGNNPAVSFSAGPDGRVSGSWRRKANMRSGDKVRYGAEVILTARPDNGFVFHYWDGACAGQSDARCVLSTVTGRSVSQAFFACDELLATAANGSVNGVKCNLKFRADVNRANDDGWTALHAAAFGGHAEVARLLLDAGAEVNARDDHGRTPLYRVFGDGRANDLETAQVLIAAGGHHGAACAAPQTVNPRGNEPACAGAVTVSYSHSAGGTVRAEWGGDADIGDGGLAATGVTVTFSALADSAGGYEFSSWGGDCAGVSPPECMAVATVNLAVSADFSCRDFHGSAAGGDLAAVGCNLANDADADAADGDGNAPLHLAVLNRRAAAAAVLLDGEADADLRDPAGSAPLHLALAATLEAEALVSLLLAAEANPDLKDSAGNAPLHLALTLGAAAEALVGLLLAADADPDLQDSAGNAPLHSALALGAGAEALVGILLAAGADPDLKDPAGSAPLHLALALGAEAVGLLADRGAAVNATDADGETPLAKAQAAGNFEVVRVLISAGGHYGSACPVRQVVNPYSSSPPCLLDAVGVEISVSAGGTVFGVWDGNPEVRDGGAVPRGTRVTFMSASEPGRQVAMWGGACAFRNVPSFGTAGPSFQPPDCEVEAAADVTVSAEFGCEYIYAALNSRSSAGLECHLSGGLDPNDSELAGQPLLFVAVNTRRLDIVEFLLRQGASVNAYSFSRTPLHRAVSGRHLEMVDLLLEWGADVNGTVAAGRFEAGETALHGAAFYGLFDIAERLLEEEGVNVNVVSREGATALRNAYEFRHGNNRRMAELLIAAGAHYGAPCPPGDPVNPKSHEPPCLKYYPVFLSPSPSAGGTILASWSEDSDLRSGESVLGGASVTFTAEPSAGRRLTLWGGACAGVSVSAPSCGVAATAAVTVSADFGCLDFHDSARSGDVAGLKCNVGSGADVNATTGEETETPLRLASDAGRSEAVRYLLSAGGHHGTECASPAVVNPFSSSPSCVGVASYSLSLSFGGTVAAAWSEDADSRPGEDIAAGATVTFTAVPDAGYALSLWGGACDSASGPRCVLAVSLEATVAASFACTDLHAAAAAGNLAGVECYLTGGGDVNEADGLGETALHLAAENGRLEAAGFLLTMGADVSVANAAGETALHLAAGEGFLELAELLVTMGADPGATDLAGDTPLTRAAARGRSSVFRFLARAGGNHGMECVDPQVPNPAGDSPQCVLCGTNERPSAGLCECVSAHARLGGACVATAAVSLSYSAGGTLSAGWAEDPEVSDGEAVPVGAAVTFSATPDSGYEISGWSGCAPGSASATVCVLDLQADAAVSVSFADIDECATGANSCAARISGGRCENTPGAHECSCAEGYSGDGFSCALEVRTVSLSHSPGGTLSAGWSGDAEVASGETVPYGAVVTFTATPADEIKISLWSGGCAGASSSESVCVLTATVALDVAVEFFADCAGRFRAAGADAYSRCGDCLAEYGEMGGGHCVHLQDAPTENRMTCEEVFGGDWEAAGDSAGVCSGIDINDTFCFLGVADALPCQGLFLHVRDCNLKHNRPALDPWHCGKACADGKAVGAWCLGSE